VGRTSPCLPAASASTLTKKPPCVAAAPQRAKWRPAPQKKKQNEHGPADLPPMRPETGQPSATSITATERYLAAPFPKVPAEQSASTTGPEVSNPKPPRSSRAPDKKRKSRKAEVPRAASGSSWQKPRTTARTVPGGARKRIRTRRAARSCLTVHPGRAASPWNNRLPRHVCRPAGRRRDAATIRCIAESRIPRQSVTNWAITAAGLAAGPPTATRARHEAFRRACQQRS